MLLAIEVVALSGEYVSRSLINFIFLSCDDCLEDKSCSLFSAVLYATVPYTVISTRLSSFYRCIWAYWFSLDFS